VEREGLDKPSRTKYQRKAGGAPVPWTFRP
jgi:hypothetical protein